MPAGAQVAVGRDHSDPEVSIENSHTESEGMETYKRRNADNFGRQVYDVDWEVTMETEDEMALDVNIVTPQAPIVFDDPPGIKPLSKHCCAGHPPQPCTRAMKGGIGAAGELLDRSSLRGQTGTVCDPLGWSTRDSVSMQVPLSPQT